MPSVYSINYKRKKLKTVCSCKVKRVKYLGSLTVRSDFVLFHFKHGVRFQTDDDGKGNVGLPGIAPGIWPGSSPDFFTRLLRIDAASGSSSGFAFGLNGLELSPI